ncbi:MAG TPA: hypothetical protein VMF32_18540 [Xanthobacteraceae bacterium]|nr:hypothetical protein [Xanthobacteraceae bacterium]
MTAQELKIGGFFGLHEPDYGAPEDSILQRWTMGREFAAFSNARSVFAALVKIASPRRVWLPAYICGTLIAESWRERLRFYHLLPSFAPDVAELDREATAGDLVLAVDYFGFPPGAEFLRFVERRRDLMFVENRAQALDTGIEPWADWTLYSPRKLLGVADGGILVSERAGRQVPRPQDRPDAIALWTAPLLRYEDRTESNNQIWHEANQEKKAWMKVDACEMTRWTSWILSHTTLQPLAQRRRANWRVLRSRLGRWLACDGNPDAVPFGYIIKVPADRRPAILRSLHRGGIFAAVHYPSLPSPAESFAAEHTLRSQIITLPCDHRYDEDAMHCVAEKVLALVA